MAKMLIVVIRTKTDNLLIGSLTETQRYINREREGGGGGRERKKSMCELEGRRSFERVIRSVFVIENWRFDSIRFDWEGAEQNRDEQNE